MNEHLTEPTFTTVLSEAQRRFQERQAHQAAAQAAQEETNRTTLTGAWAAVGALLPEELLEYARIELEQYAGLPVARVQLTLDAFQMAPVWCALRWNAAYGWALCASGRGFGFEPHAVGFYVSTQYFAWAWNDRIEADTSVGSLHITPDLAEALSYALEGWPSYKAACDEVAARQELPF
jgi:hypothetical protein